MGRIITKLGSLGGHCARRGCIRPSVAPMLLGDEERIEFCAEHYEDAARRIDAHNEKGKELFASLKAGL